MNGSGPPPIRSERLPDAGAGIKAPPVLVTRSLATAMSAGYGQVLLPLLPEPPAQDGASHSCCGQAASTVSPSISSAATVCMTDSEIAYLIPASVVQGDRVSVQRRAFPLVS
jgi:hypothetical protein